MKRLVPRTIRILLLGLLFLTTGRSFAQTTYTWQGANNASWATSTNWTPTRTAPATNDILQFNTGTTLNITGVPNQTIGRFVMSNNTNITLQSSGANTLTIGNGTGTDLDIASGSTLTIGGSNSLTVTLASNATASIAGTLTINSGRTYNTNGTGVVTTVTGTINHGGTLTNSTASKLVFSSGGTYNFTQNGGINIATATWNAASNCNITGVTSTVPTVASFSQAFGNFTWNCPSQNADLSLIGNLGDDGTAPNGSIAGNMTITSTGTGSLRLSNSGVTASLAIGGNFSQTGGTFYIGGTGGTNDWIVDLTGDFSLSGGTFNMAGGGGTSLLNVGGDFSVTGGTLTESSTATCDIVFNGSTTQTYTSGATISNTINFTVNSGTTLQMATPTTVVSGGGTFDLLSGAILGVTSTVGISTSGATGNIQVTGTRTYVNGASYIYNGSANQVAGNGLTQNTPANLTIDNPNTVSLSANTTITGSILISQGTLSTSASNYNITLDGNWTNNGSFTAGNSTTTFTGTTQAIGGSNSTSFNALVIDNGSATTMNNNNSCSSLSFTAGGSNSSLTHAGSSTLTVNGTVTLNQPTAGATKAWNINAGSATVSGLISMAGTATNTNRISQIVLTTGTLNANAGISIAGTVASTKIINMSGGASTINLRGSLTGSGNATLTAGTSGSIFNYSDPGASQTVNFFGAGAYHNLHINTTGGTGATLSAAITATNVTGNLRVQSGTLNNGGFAITGNASRTLEVVNGAFLKLGGTTSAFPTGFGTVSLGATSTVDYNGSGNQTIAAQNYGNLTVTANGTRTITLANSGTIGIAGVFSPAGGATSYTNTGSTVRFNGTTGGQNIPAFSFNNLTIDNTSDVTLTGNVNVQGTTNALTFTNGKINTGSNTITLSSGVTVSGAGAAKYVNGNQAWIMPTGTPTRTFVIGDATNYTPVTVAYTTSITTGGTLTANTTAGDHPQIGSSLFQANKTANRYWTLTNSGILPSTPGYTATFTFINPGDLDAGANTANFIVKRYSGSWNATTVGTRTGTSTQASAINGYGDFQAGEDCSAPSINTPSVTNVSCNGGSDGAIDITTTGGAGPFTYAWSNSAITEDISGLSAGSYSLTITANGGCTVNSGTINVTEPAVLNATVNSANVTCNAANDGTITISSPTGGYGTYEYSINGGGSWQASGSYTGLAPNTYNVRMRDAANTSCVKILNASLTITEPAVLNATVNSSNITCNASNDGTITISSPTGGYGTYEYSINGGGSWQASGSFTGLAPNTYDVRMRDAANTSCVKILNASLTITEPAVLNATVNSANITCNAANDGSITISSPTGGYGTYEYSINGGGSWQASGSFTGLAPNTYDVRMRDAANTSCVKILNASLAITEPALLSATVNSSNITCNAANDGSITISSPTGGYGTYEYSINGGGSWQFSGSFTGLNPNTFDVRMRDASNPSCTRILNGALTLTEPAVLNATVNSGNVTCNAGSDGSITISSPTGGYGTYEYSINGGGSWQASGNFTGLTANTYDVRIRDAAQVACVVILNASLTITEPSAIPAPTSGGDQTVCTNFDPLQTLTATATSGFTITWYDAASGGNVVPVPSLVGPGTVTYYAEAGNGVCVSATRTAVTLTINAAPTTPGSITGPTDVCVHTNTGIPITYSIAPVGGVSSYVWAVPNGATIVSGQGTTSIDVLIDNSFATTNQQFKVRTVSAQGCLSQPSSILVTKTVPGIPTQIFGPTNVCDYVGQPGTVNYYINPVAGASGYTWAVGNGITLVSGQGTTSVQVSFAGNFTFAGIRVTATSNCGSRSPRTLSLTKVIPATPGTISGPTNACAYVGTPTPATYSISPVSGAASYLWTVPAGVTISSGQGTTSIDVTFGSGYTSGSIKVRAVANCGSSADQQLAVGVGIPDVPGTISGPTSACSYLGTNTQVTYSISPVSGAGSYQWTVPANMTIVSGQGTTSLTVTFGNSFLTSDIKVKSVSACGSSTDASLTITAANATPPGAISGPTNACQFIGTIDEATYTIRKVASATNYIWTAPAGATITSHPGGSGANDTIVTVSFDNSFVSGTSLQVQSVNCNTSLARNLVITRATAAAGLISGPTNVCEYMVSGGNPSGTPAVYTIRKVAAAQSYNWTAPANASIVANPGGAGSANDTIIHVIYNSNFTGGTISVSANNGCGTGVLRNLSVSRLTPGTPGAITATQTQICPAREYTYSISSMPTNSTSLLWTVPAGGTILSGQGTTSITVSYTSGAINGNVTATGISNCGNSSTRNLAVKLTACPLPFAGSGSHTENQKGQVISDNSQAFSASVSPNPTSSSFRVILKGAGNEPVKVRVLDLTGSEKLRYNLTAENTSRLGANLLPGTYLVEITQGNNRVIQKLIKL